MGRFVEEADRVQWALLPGCLDDFIDESNPVRVVDVFVDALDLAELSFKGIEPAAKERCDGQPSVSWRGATPCPELEEYRNWLAQAQTVAFDPERTSS